MFRATVLYSFVSFVAALGHGTMFLKTWEQELDSSQETPVTRVVKLLKEMSATLQRDQDDDEATFKKMGCWCNDGKYEKQEAIKVSKAEIEQLSSDIDLHTAKSAGLRNSIKELETQFAADKDALAQATVLREKQLAEFQGMETDNVQALENLRAAIEVLSKHQNAPPSSTVAGGAVFKSERDSWSFIQAVAGNLPWTEAHEESRGARSLDEFMRSNGFATGDVGVDVQKTIGRHKFLQATAVSVSGSNWSPQDLAVVRKAFKTVALFVQAHHREAYYPTYTTRSGEIFGVLKQFEEEMSGDLGEAQKIEQDRAAAFAELRSAKSAQIAQAEKLAEQHEDELANTDNLLAEAKENLEEENKVLAANEAFLASLIDTCDKGGVAFEERKQKRFAEMAAVTETIKILQSDEARDAMSSTYSFLEIRKVYESDRRLKAAEVLRKVARKSHSPEMAMLATSAELDVFTKVKAAIDDMIGMLNHQQEDEVKKNDWCKVEIHTNEMMTAKKQDEQAGLEAHIAELATTIKTMEQDIADGHAQIAQSQLDLQRATEDRQMENRDFQKTVHDQTVVIEVLKKALERLAKYYDFLQQKASNTRNTPPVPQKDYEPSKAAPGVMEMIEKLIHEAQDLRTESRTAESVAQAAYETLIGETNAAVQALQKEVSFKEATKAVAHKDKLLMESDLKDIVKEFDGLAKYNNELHRECDYLLRNFDLRQQKRREEVEALQQAKQILNGASLT